MSDLDQELLAVTRSCIDREFRTCDFAFPSGAGQRSTEDRVVNRLKQWRGGERRKQKCTSKGSISRDGAPSSLSRS